MKTHTVEDFQAEMFNNDSEDVEYNIALNRFSQQKNYPSDVIGCFIVNAVTGEQFPWKVGSLNERRFFKAINVTDNTSHQLFYENPYQYMEHRAVELSKEFIKNWYTKKNELYPGKYNYSE